MATEARCPECARKGKLGENLYIRKDGTFGCRTCGYDSRKESRIKSEKKP